MYQIKESDWKALKRMHPIALERFSRHVLAEIHSITQDKARDAHRRYLDIYDTVLRRDKQMGRIFNDLKRSNGFLMIALMRQEGLLSDEELQVFSIETRSVIAQRCQRRG